MQSSYEELIKQWQNGKMDVLQHPPHDRGDLHTLCGSLVERYKCNDVEIHWHLHFAVDHGKRPDLCIACHSSQIGMNKTLTVDDLGFRSIGSNAAVQSRQGNTPVFVDVAEIIENPQDRLLEIPTIVRLQTLNYCLSNVGNSSKSATPKSCIIKAIQGGADGEHIVFAGSVLCSKYKFPHQIVEGRPEILEEISKYQLQSHRDRNICNDSPVVLIRGTFVLTHHFCWVLLKIFPQISLERLEMFLRPDDFINDGIGNGHSESVPERFGQSSK